MLHRCTAFQLHGCISVPQAAMSADPMSFVPPAPPAQPYQTIDPFQNMVPPTAGPNVNDAQSNMQPSTQQQAQAPGPQAQVPPPPSGWSEPGKQQ